MSFTSMNAIIKYQPPVDPHEQFIFAMWLMFCRAPRRPGPDIDGHYDLGDIGSVPDKTWQRLNPYALAQVK